MRHYEIIFILCSLLGLLTGCSDDEENTTLIQPTESGTYTDIRDGFTYHWIQYGNLQWMVENGHYKLKDSEKCCVYQSAEAHSLAVTSNEYWQKYGCLYTHGGAVEAAPDGWRVPTDEDWQSLETVLGMSTKEAQLADWRGNIATQLREGPMQILMNGYYTDHTIMGTSGYRFMGAWAYYWTSTKDDSKNGEYYFYRKLAYNRDDICRQSMETIKNRLSVRYVRNK